MPQGSVSQRVALSPLLKTEIVLGVTNMALSNNHVIRKLLFSYFFLSSDPVMENVLRNDREGMHLHSLNKYVGNALLVSD